MELDKDLINLRIDVIERNVREIEQIVGEGEEKFLRSYRTILASRHALLESIEACIDIGNHIIASRGLRRPEDYKDVFAILGNDKIISKNLSEKLQDMAKFRNLLIHFYAKVDDTNVFAIMKKDTDDIKEFVKRVLQLIKAARV